MKIILKIYGVGHPKGNEDTYLERYLNHNKDVLEYFKDRKEDLLVVNWEKGNKWESICNFLNEPIPNEPFPHANKGNYGKKKTKPNNLDKVKMTTKKHLNELGLKKIKLIFKY